MVKRIFFLSLSLLRFYFLSSLSCYWQHMMSIFNKLLFFWDFGGLVCLASYCSDFSNVFSGIVPIFLLCFSSSLFFEDFPMVTTRLWLFLVDTDRLLGLTFSSTKVAIGYWFGHPSLRLWAAGGRGVVIFLIRCKLILIWHFFQFDEKCWKSRFPSFMGLKYLWNLF